MKVVLVSGGYPPVLDGVGDYTQKIFEEMRRQIGRESVYVVTGVSENRTDEDSNVRDVVKKWDLWGICSVLRVLKEIPADIVHIQYPSNSFERSLSASLLPLFIRIRHPHMHVFCTIHEFDNKTLKGKFRLLMSMVPCHGIVIVSELYRTNILRFCPFLSDRVAYVPIGSNISDHKIDSIRTRALRQNLGWAQDDPVLAYFGILREGKGLDDLIDAFLVARDSLTNLRLLLIGGAQSGFAESRFLAKLKAAGAVNAIMLTGRVGEQEVSEYLSLTDLCVLPFEDGISTKRTGFMAAVEHGLPILTTRPAHEINELLDGQNVMLVTAGDVPGLARQIQAILANQDLRETLRQNVLALRRLYSWEVIVKNLLALYRATSGGHPIGSKKAM